MLTTHKKHDIWNCATRTRPGPNIFTTLTIMTEFSEVNPSSVISAPETDKTIYVDANNGGDNNDGATEATAVKTLKKALLLGPSRAKISVMNGVYNNGNYGLGDNNGAVLIIKVFIKNLMGWE